MKKFDCLECGKSFKTEQGAADHQRDVHGAGNDPDTAPDWSGSCEVCGQSPVVPITGMCGPCTFGEAATAGGDW